MSIDQKMCYKIQYFTNHSDCTFESILTGLSFVNLDTANGAALIILVINLGSQSISLIDFI